MTLLVMMAASLRLFRDLRQILPRVAATLSSCELAAQETRRVVSEARHLLARTTQTTHRVDAVVDKTCHTASELLESVGYWTGKANTFLVDHFGNGNGAPRRHHRGSRH